MQSPEVEAMRARWEAAQERSIIARLARPHVISLRTWRPGSAHKTKGSLWKGYHSGINIAAGIWLLIAPIYLGYPRPICRWNDIVVGLVLIVLVILRYTHPFHRFWIGWSSAAIGLWLIAAPFVLKCDLMAAQVNDIAVGIIVFLAGAISGSVPSYGR